MALMPIRRLIGWLATQHPDRPAITCEGWTLTRRELEHRTNRLARAYQHYDGKVRRSALRDQRLAVRTPAADPSAPASGSSV